MGSAQRNLILVRDLQTPFAAFPPLDGFTTLHLRGPACDGFESLGRFCDANQFPIHWHRHMLELGGLAWLVTTTTGEPAATGWIMRGAFYVEEIRRTFDPGPDGDYYFGDFVAPAFRRRGLHRYLIHQRLAASQLENRRWAMAMTRSDNTPSLRGYQAEGFNVGSELRTRRRSGWELDSIYRTPAHLPAGAFSSEGFYLPGLGRLRRAK